MDEMRLEARGGGFVDIPSSVKLGCSMSCDVPAAKIERDVVDAPIAGPVVCNHVTCGQGGDGTHFRRIVAEQPLCEMGCRRIAIRREPGRIGNSQTTAMLM